MGEVVEVCENPWNKKCKRTDIELYILYKAGARLPICRECWKKIAPSNREW